MHLLLLACALVATACDSPTQYVSSQHSVASGLGHLAVLSGRDTLFTVSSAKWPHGAEAAVSITYDAPWGTHPDHHLATDAAIARGLPMDMEMVSWIYTQPKHQHWLDYYRTELMPRGIHFFGHGHTHALHDTMEYDAAYASFKTNYDLMAQWGLRPKAYAYPGSSGERPSTQQANQAAGFICARGCAWTPEEYYIVPDSTREPDNWYFLPSVIMGNASYRYVDVHEKLAPILDEAVRRSAWVILMYHAIGIPDGWSYYPIGDFERDLAAIQEGRMWCGNMDAVACYIQERAALRLELAGLQSEEQGGTCLVRLDDGLPDEVFDEPLWVEVRSHVGSLEVIGPGGLPSQADGETYRFTAVPDGSTCQISWSRE